MDILFQATDKTVQVAIEDEQKLGSYKFVNFFSEFVIQPTEDPNCKAYSSTDLLSMPNSNAFVDFDGDCMPDLFLTRQTGT